MKNDASSERWPADVTWQRLVEFRSRRRQLSVWRGLSCVMAVFASLLLFAVLADALLDHPFVRWTSSCILYALTAFAAYVLWFRPLSRPLHWPTEAEQFEQYEPRLRECLLPAVELASQACKPGDSEQFTMQLQRQVAKLIEPVDVRLLLSWSSIRRFLWIGSIAATVILGPCLIPGLRFPHRMARALLPAADLGRVTSIAIEISSPLPASQTVPQGDHIPIVALITGPHAPEHVQLETRVAPSVQLLREQMAAVSPISSHLTDNQYEGIVVADTRLEYRVAAAGAYTPWYRLAPKPRPQVTRFEKTVSPPVYVGTASETRSEPHGDIRALVGSQVRLTMSVDQDVDVALLQWQPKNSKEAASKVDLSFNPETQTYSTRFTVTDSCDYRILLRSRETGFTNPFSKTYHIDAIPDLAPIVEWKTPANTQVLTAEPSQLIDLQVSTSDELSLRELQLATRINGQQQQLSRLASDLAPDATHGWTFDLVPFQASPGDYVDLQVYATDLNGSRGESSPLRILISSTSIDLEPSPEEKLLLQLASQLEDLADRLRDTAGQDEDAQDLDSNERAARARDIEDILRSEVPELISQVQRVSNDVSNLVSSLELRLVGEFLTQLQAKVSNHRWNALNDSEKTHRGFVDSVQTIARQVRIVVSFDVFRRHSEQIHRLAVAHSALAAEKKLSKAQRLRRHEILVQQIASVQQAIMNSIDTVHSNASAKLHLTIDSLEHITGQLERKVDRSQIEELVELAASTGEQLADTRLISYLDGNLPQEIHRAHQWLFQNVQSPTVSIHPILESLAHGRAPDRNVQTAIEQLALHRQLRRNGPSRNPAFPKDLGDARRALVAVMNSKAAIDERSANLNTISDALEVLEIAAGFQEVSERIRRMLAIERRSLEQNDTRIQQPRYWNSVAAQIEDILRKSKTNRLPRAWIARVDRLRRGTVAQTIERRMKTRLWENDPLVSAGNQLETLQRDLRQIELDLSPAVFEARAKLAALMPKLSELARVAAQKSRDLGEQSQSLAEAIERDLVPEPRSRIDQLQATLSHVQEPLSELREAMVDQADSQNLLTGEGLDQVRRSDAALNVLDRVDQQLVNSLAVARNSLGPRAQSDSLASAASRQLDAAAALDQLAELLDGNQADDSPDSLPESVARLEALAQRLDAAEQSLDNQDEYAEAEQLSELASTNPQEVLQQLEEKLKSSPPMQQEMSEIVRQTVEQALDELQHAQLRQSQLQPALENSDSRLLERKRLLLYDLRSAQESASLMLGMLLNETQWTAGAARADSAARVLDSLDTQLRAAVDNLESSNEQSAFVDIRAQAELLRTTLVQVHERISEIQPALNEAGQMKIHPNGADLNNSRRRMKDRQRRIQQQDVRNAQQIERSRRQQLKQTEHRQQKLLREVSKQSENVQQLQDKLDTQPELQPQLNDMSRQLEQARIAESAGTSLRDAIQQRLTKAQQSVQSATGRELPTLSSPNPAADLSLSLAQLTIERSKQLADALAPWSDAEPTSQATTSQLSTSLKTEEEIEQELNHVSRNLARAARHETRLERAYPAEQLKTLEKTVAEVARQEIQAANRSLSEALQESQNAGIQSGRAGNVATGSALQASAVAESAITDAAALLQTLLEKRVPTTSPDDIEKQQATPGGSNDSRSEPALDSKQMAELLDELDRMLNHDLSLGPQEDESAAAPNAESKGQSQPGALPNQLTEAAKQLASRMSRQREPPPANATSDLGMATEPGMATIDPQGPIAVRVIDVQRFGRTWGELRQRNATGSVETRRSQLAPRIQAQVDAYFRNLAVQSQQQLDSK